MIGVSSDMVLESVVLSFLLGVFSGAFRALIFGTLSFFRLLLSRAEKSGKTRREKRFLINVFDFFFFFAVGILYLLVLYVGTDGVFFVSSAVSLCIGFCLGKGFVCAFLKLLVKIKK